MRKFSAKIGVTALSVLALAAAESLIFTGNPKAALINVDCGISTLQPVIDVASPGDFITITGNCAEQIFIEINNLSIVGATPTDGIDGSISVDGAQDVAIGNMTIKNGVVDGINVVNNAHVAVSLVTISGQAGNGMSVSTNSLASLLQSVITDNRRGGVEAVGGANVLISATITDNDENGVFVAGGSNVDIGDSTITGNDENGVFVAGGSTVTIGTSTISDNRGHGVALTDNSVAVVNGTISDNDRDGVLAERGSTVNIEGSTISSNMSEGVKAQEGSTVVIRGSTTISDNSAEGVEVIEGSSVEIRNSTISGNMNHGIALRRMSSGDINNSMIFDNAERALLIINSFGRVSRSMIASDVPANGISVNRNGNLELNGGNFITNTATEVGGGTAISVGMSSLLHSQNDRDPGDAITSTNGLALRIQNQSQGDLRSFTVTGDVLVSRHSLLRLQKEPNGLITGDIEIERDSAISFGLAGFGPVQVIGTITCADTESSADFDDQMASDIVGGDGSDFDCTGYDKGKKKP